MTKDICVDQVGEPSFENSTDGERYQRRGSDGRRLVMIW